MKADRPKTADAHEYHLHTQAGDLAPFCLIVGAPGRADMIGERFFTEAVRFANEGRGLVSVTGLYHGLPVSVTTSGMGGASMGIILPEAYRSGARIFIRAGSCGSLIKESQVGDSIIVTAAIRRDGVSHYWAPVEFPACADYRVIGALITAASNLAPGNFWSGIECTTSEFNVGQGRPNMQGIVPPHMQAQHEEMLRLGVSCYSMEASALFVWCATEGGGLPCGAINAVFANRHTNEWGVAGEEQAAQIALDALVVLSGDSSLNHLIN